MKNFKVEIMPCGTKAKTVNPLGKHVICNDPCYCFNRWQCDKFKEWVKEENSRKAYEIEKEFIGYKDLEEPSNVIYRYKPSNNYERVYKKYKPGSIHEATEINTKQIRIL